MRRLASISLCLAATLAAAVPAAAAPAPALPDTGIFAPVAARYRARVAHLGDSERGAMTPGRIRLLLATGQPDLAASLAPKMTGDPNEVLVARARVHLARLEFAPLAAEIAELDRDPHGTPASRAVRFAYRVARDDAAGVDALSRPATLRTTDANAIPELLAAGRLAYDQLDYPRADSLFMRALAVIQVPADAPAWGSEAGAARALALTGRALVQQKRRDWEGSLATLEQALAADGNAEVLMVLTETMIRLGRTDDAISATEWAVKLTPYHEEIGRAHV